MANRFNDFVAKIKDIGVAKSSLFFVEMPPPPFLLQDVDSSRVDMINLMVQDTVLPQMQVNGAMIKDDGLDRQAVVDKHYGETEFTFLVDQDMVIKKYFDDWMQNIVVSKGGVFAYYNEYTVDTITVNQLNAAREIVYSVNLHDAFPVDMSPLSLSMQHSGFHYLRVRFTYRWWESNALTSDANLSNVPDDVSRFLLDQSTKTIPSLPQLRELNSNMRNGINRFNISGNSGATGNNIASSNGQSFNFNF